jgi:hypothetical protein
MLHPGTRICDPLLDFVIAFTGVMAGKGGGAHRILNSLRDRTAAHKGDASGSHDFAFRFRHFILLWFG